ncbi:MAG: Mth938-like domain-containing protein [Gammaproteobacteria bacterium]
MRIDLDPGDDSSIQINAYENQRIQIDSEWYEQNIMIYGKKVTSWPVESLDKLTESDLSELIASKPEIILFGTGDQLILLNQKLQYILLSNDIGVEFMTTQAACRTYNILASEGRRVLACLVLA